MRQIKIGQIVAAPLPGKTIGTNGPERRAANLIGYWKNVGVDVTIFYPRRGQMWGKFVGASVKVINFEIFNKLNFLALFKLIYETIRGSLSLIHSQGPPSVDFIASIAGFMTRRPVVVTRPNPRYLLNRPYYWRPIYKVLDYVGLFLANRIITVCNTGKDELIGHYPNLKNKIITINNGVDYSKYAMPSRKYSNSKEKLRIGMVAQLNQGKGWHDFVKTIEQLLRLGKKVTGHIFGSGPLEEEIRHQIERTGYSHFFIFHGQIVNIEDELKNLDIFLFTSYSEGLPMAILEALASGLPVISTNVGGIPEIISHELTGLLVSPGDILKMIEFTTTLVERPEIRASLGQSGTKLVSEKYTENSMLNSYKETYYELIEKKF